MFNAEIQENFFLEPYPYLELSNIFEESFFEQLVNEFPRDSEFESAESLRSRATHNIYYTDPQFEQLIERSLVWHELYSYINSEAFLKYFLSKFSYSLPELGLIPEPDRLHFESYKEGRHEITHVSRFKHYRDWLMGMISLRSPLVFSRLDLSLGGVGYGKPPHADNANRLGGAVLYLNSAEETGTNGGDFQIWDVRPEFKGERLGRMPDESKLSLKRSIPFKKNTAIVFPCHDYSYHSVAPINHQDECRKFLYLSLSFKSHSVWK